MAQDTSEQWLRLTIRDVEATAFEIPRVSRLLIDLSSALYAIARRKLGSATDRPGPRSASEEHLAGVRLVRLEPGSMVIELAPPPDEPQAKLPLIEEATPDDVALELYKELQSIFHGEAAPDTGAEIRRRVLAVVQDAGEMGARAEIVFHPRRLPGQPKRADELRHTFDLTRIPETPELPVRTRRRRLVGHAYMVDVEPGRERIRIKMTDGRDITLSVDESAFSAMGQALDKLVDIEVEEEFDGATPIQRVIRELELVPPPEESPPPKSIEELEREQRIPKRPDYVALASGVWRTKEELDEFERYLRELRRA